ncbi:hypothetical protein E4T48_03296 [Aureobasidium sp. EXF-10727]|nr:hypothetical protein E4T48_03296 [Aureobasidium sp. EXF-10727]
MQISAWRLPALAHLKESYVVRREAREAREAFDLPSSSGFSHVCYNFDLFLASPSLRAAAFQKLYLSAIPGTLVTYSYLNFAWSVSTPAIYALGRHEKLLVKKLDRTCGPSFDRIFTRLPQCCIATQHELFGRPCERNMRPTPSLYGVLVVSLAHFCPTSKHAPLSSTLHIAQSENADPTNSVLQQRHDVERLV